MSSSQETSAKAPNILLDGAMEQFKRHGFSKTSMSDIARASGLSRTSLYNHFQTKEDVFKVLSSRINEQVLDAIVEAMNSSDPWDKRLASVVHARVGWVYQLLNDSEYGRELINEKNRICGGQVLASNEQFQSLVITILKEGLPEKSELSRLADILLNSINGVLEKAESRKEAQGNVAMLVKLLCQGAARIE